MIEALRIISDEHRNMWRVLVTLDEMADEILAEGKFDQKPFAMIFDYIATFVDRLHHPKEDAYLFRLLRQRHPSSGAILDTLEGEHAGAPDRLSGLRAALSSLVMGGSVDQTDFAQMVKAYALDIKNHIHLEEKTIHPLARSHLTAEDWAAIAKAFGDNNDPLFNETARIEFREAYHRIASIAPASVGLGGIATGSLSPSNDKKTERPLLEIRGLQCGYGHITVLRKIEIDIHQGELVALVGSNGAGKTTLLKAISGIQPLTAGHVSFDGTDISRLASDQRVRRGICQVPEGRQVFGPLSVEDNLRLGGCSQPKAQVAKDLPRIWEMFPILWEKRRQPAGTLSGGQQQILAIGRALMARPRLLLLDEPSMGLAPLLVEEVFNVISALKSQGITIFLVEQNAFAALEIAERGYVLEAGEIKLSGTGADLLENDAVKAAYLGM